MKKYPRAENIVYKLLEWDEANLKPMFFSSREIFSKLARTNIQVFVNRIPSLQYETPL